MRVGHDESPIEAVIRRSWRGSNAADGVAPALGTAAVVGRPPITEYRPDCGAGGAMPGLALGIGQRSLAERGTRHGLSPKRYVTERGVVLHKIAPDQARFLNA